MHTAIEVIPEEEIRNRQRKCREILAQRCPEAGGLLVFARANIYYLTGTFAMGLLWLPLEGEPVLAVRKGIERAALESPYTRACTYKSYSQLARVLDEAGSPLSGTIAVEYNSLSWGLGVNLTKNLSDHKLIPGDEVCQRLRTVKSAWELNKTRLAGRRQYSGMCEILPGRIKYNISEYDASALLWSIFFELGHIGPARMSALGEEVFLGHVSTAENAAYPSYYLGPLGVKGVHPTAALMGYAGSVWAKDSFIGMDVGFVLEGYNTDKTQFYFAGKKQSAPAQLLKAQETCLSIQYELAARLKPGAIPQELYRFALGMAEKAGFADGFMGYKGNRVPFVGHSIGLNVDEWPVLADKFTDPLQENMVIALEPKITVPGLGMVGVENTFLVTAGGGESLTTRTGSLDDDNGDVIYFE